MKSVNEERNTITKEVENFPSEREKQKYELKQMRERVRNPITHLRIQLELILNCKTIQASSLSTRAGLEKRMIGILGTT